MALHMIPPPPESLTALENALQPGTSGTVAGLRSLTSVDEARQPMNSHPVYVLGADSLAQGKGLTEATLVSWRHLVGGMAGGYVAAEVSVDAKRNVHEFASFNEGPHVEGTLVQLAAAQKDPRVTSGEYELRLLRIPALYVVALWLKDRDGDDDLFVPIGPVAPPLLAGNTYTTTEIEQLLKGPAADRLKFDDSPKP